MNNIICVDGYALNSGDNDWEDCDDIGTITSYPYAPKEDRETIRRIGNATTIIINKTIINKTVIDACPNLKFIAVAATGYNVVDTKYAKEKGILVANVPVYGTTTVSEFTFAQIMALARRVELNSNDVKNKMGWCRSKDWTYWLSPQIELHNKTLGIVGFGNIGKSVGKIAAALGLKVIAHDKYFNNDTHYDVKNVELDELFSTSDFVTLHCPALPDTINMINKQSLGKMKNSAFLINCSRGQLVVEQELANALNDGVIAGAALDVLQKEPPEESNPLLTAKNCLITPHIAWATVDARERIAQVVVNNIRAFQQGKPENIVN